MTKQAPPLQEIKTEHDIIAFIHTDNNRGIRIVNRPVSIRLVISIIVAMTVTLTAITVSRVIS